MKGTSCEVILGSATVGSCNCLEVHVQKQGLAPQDTAKRKKPMLHISTLFVHLSFISLYK